MSQAARVALPIVLTRPGGAGRGKLFVLFLTAFHGGRAGRARPTTSRCQLVCVSGKMRQGGGRPYISVECLVCVSKLRAHL